MPDRQSNYQHLRLNLHPSPDGASYEWALLAIATVNGVPRSRMLDTGRAIAVAEIDSQEALWENLSALAVMALRR